MRSIYTTDYERIIGELVAARKRAGLTQAQVGARLQRDQTFVSKYERRERHLDVVEFKFVCDVLDINAAALIDTTTADIRETTETTT